MPIPAHRGDTDSVVWEGTQGSVGLTACVIFNQVNLGHTVLFPQRLRSLSRTWRFIARIFMITSQDRSCDMGLRQEDGVRWESKVALRMWFSEDPQQPAFVTLPSRRYHQQDSSVFSSVASYFSCACQWLYSFLFQKEREPDWLS